MERKIINKLRPQGKPILVDFGEGPLYVIEGGRRSIGEAAGDCLDHRATGKLRKTLQRLLDYGFKSAGGEKTSLVKVNGKRKPIYWILKEDSKISL